MLKRYGEDVSGHHRLRTPSKAWHAMAVPWYKIVLLSPLLWIVAMLAAPRLWRPMIFVGLVLASQWAVNTLVVTEPWRATCTCSPGLHFCWSPYCCKAWCDTPPAGS